MQGNDQLSINAIRMLSVDMINKANSGHPGICLGAAPMAYSLWTRFIRQNPENPAWTNRDRFILSPGHGSAMLYSLLHLSGFNLAMEELKNFRQLGSLAPGHPEWKMTDGVEATTGPLGQGFANACGMAMAEAHLSAIYNKKDYPIVDHYTYCIASDGDLMEGVVAEAASLAGAMGLGKLIVLFDSNDICLDGPTANVFRDNHRMRFESYGWQYQRVEDGNDIEAISKAVELAKKEKNKPSIIEVKTLIGFGSPNQGTAKTHGAPIGEEDTVKLREELGWQYPAFEIPETIYENFKEKIIEPGKKAEQEWNDLFASYKKDFPDLADQYENSFAGKLPENWDKDLPKYRPEDSPLASRAASGKTIQAIAKNVPQFWGGSADLSSSNKTNIDGSPKFRIEDDKGRNIWYGVREHAMAAINNGIAYHGGTKVFGSTFFVFSDYMRGAVRVAALSGLPVIYVLTHDSVAVGEDGPTHQPIETLASWRAMQGLDVIRPADGNETSYAWKVAMENNDRPTMLILSRQGLENLEGSLEKAEQGVEAGAYIISEAPNGKAEGILIGTGSEVSLCMEAQKKLAEMGHHVRVVSMPSMNRFEDQTEEYREEVLPKAIKKRISIEAGTTFGWDRYVGDEGLAIGINRFGLSAPGSQALKELGMSADNIVKNYLERFAE